MEKKYTPGPWDIIRAGAALMIYGPVGQRICKILFPEISAEREANAHLISAAPELLEALESLIENYKRVDGLGFESLPVGTALAAIRKAHGESEGK
jgi:hypothetical protein